MRPTVKRRRKRVVRINVCLLCENRIRFVDFKDTDLLRRYQTEKGRILPRRITGTCYLHQKMLTEAIKRARNLAMVM